MNDFKKSIDLFNDKVDLELLIELLVYMRERYFTFNCLTAPTHPLKVSTTSLHSAPCVVVNPSVSWRSEIIYCAFSFLYRFNFFAMLISFLDITLATMALTVYQEFGVMSKCFLLLPYSSGAIYVL